jgi:hypothetical protein
MSFSFSKSPHKTRIEELPQQTPPKPDASLVPLFGNDADSRRWNQERAVAMPPSHITNQLQLEGVLRRVDVIGREIEVADQATQMTMMVPPDCQLYLHGEPVKLRLLLPGDRLRISYRELSDTLVACVVEAQSGG